jgi:hypothetical protein
VSGAVLSLTGGITVPEPISVGGSGIVSGLTPKPQNPFKLK